MNYQSDNYKLSCRQGKTFRKTVTYLDNGSAMNLTGYSARMQIRPKASSTTLYVDLTVANGGIIMGGTAGTIGLFIPKATMEQVPAGMHQYELEVIEPGGEIPDTLTISGPFLVEAEVTR